MVWGLSLLTSTAAAFAATSATTTAVAATASAAFAGKHLKDALNLVVGGFAALDNLALEVELLACQGMVEVDDDVFLANALNETVEALTLCVLQGYDGTFVDVLAVNLSVYLEDAAWNLLYEVGVVLAIALLDIQGEVEGVALIEGDDVCLEGVERNTQSGHEHVGILAGCGLDAFSLATFNGS